MRKFYLLFLLILLLSCQETFSQNLGWRRLLDKPTFDIAVNPQNLNTVFVGGMGRLLYRTFNGGLTWDTLIVGNLGGGSFLNNVLINPIDTNILLVGGIQFGNLQRSTDQGMNWDVVLSTLGNLLLNGKSLMFKPDNANIVYAGDWHSGTMFRSTDMGATFDSLSTVMDINTYSDTLGILHDTLENTTIGCTGIRGDSTNILFIGTTTGVIFISHDGGSSWDKIATLTHPAYDQTDCEITRITFSDEAPLTGYACITYAYPGNTPNGGLFKTTDGGYNWRQVAFADTSIWATACRNYGDVDEVFMGGYTEDFYSPHDNDRIPGSGMVRRSMDGGNTWWNYDNNISWSVVYTNYNCPYHSIFWAKADTGFIVGNLGTIQRTTDGGISWSKMAFPDQLILNSAFFTDGHNGYVVGENGKIIKTNNGFINALNLGNGTSYLNSGTNATLNSVFCLSLDSVFVVGDGGVLLQTTNAGSDWNKIDLQTQAGLKSIYFTDKLNGYIASDDGKVFSTTDGGNNWNQLQTGNSVPLNSVTFFNPDSGIAVGEKGIILRTTDAGQNWNKITNNSQFTLFSVCHISNGIGYAAGDSGIILKTTDFGYSWQRENCLTYRPIYCITFKDDGVGYTAGIFATVMKLDTNNIWNYTQLYGSGIHNNCWSLRYFGLPGDEKLYLASEAGFFILDDPSDVPDYIKNQVPDRRLNVTLTPDKTLFVSYKRNNPNDLEPVRFRMVNLLGQVVLDKQINGYDNDALRDFVSIQNIPNGAYICQIIEKGMSTSEVVPVNY